MPHVIAYEKALDHQRERAHDIRVPFLTNSAASPHQPAAFLSKGALGKVIGPHWHAIDQFQVITEGSGKLGRKDVARYAGKSLAMARKDEDRAGFPLPVLVLGGNMPAWLREDVEAYYTGSAPVPQRFRGVSDGPYGPNNVLVAQHALVRAGLLAHDGTLSAVGFWT